MAKKEKSQSGIRTIKLTYADLETENRMIRAQLGYRDERIRDLASMRDQETNRRILAEDQAKTANAALKQSQQNNAHLKDVLLQAQLDVASLQGYRDRVREQDSENRPLLPVIRGMDLAQPNTDRTETCGQRHGDSDWINRL